MLTCPVCRTPLGEVLHVYSGQSLCDCGRLSHSVHTQTVWFSNSPDGPDLASIGVHDGHPPVLRSGPCSDVVPFGSEDGYRAVLDAVAVLDVLDS